MIGLRADLPLRETLIRDLMDYSSPVRIVAFNTSEGWSRDVTMDIADEVPRFAKYAEVRRPGPGAGSTRF